MLATVGHVNFLMKSFNQWSLSMVVRRGVVGVAHRTKATQHIRPTSKKNFNLNPKAYSQRSCNVEIKHDVIVLKMNKVYNFYIFVQIEIDVITQEMS